MTDGNGTSNRVKNGSGTEASSQLTRFGPGKIIVLGEHAAVYGEPVLAGAIQRGVTARAVSGVAGIQVPRDLSPAQGEALRRAFAAVSAIAKAPPVSVSVTSDLPVGMGLGSSAALSVAGS